MTGRAPLPAVRVLVVDDSAAMRAILYRILSADAEIEVVGLAPEPYTAREMIRELNPDVLTLDVEMPGMDGLTFLEKIMRLRSMPVIMCSTLTARGTEVAIEALRLGAIDCIAKPLGGAADMIGQGEALCRMVKVAARSTISPRAGRVPPRPAVNLELGEAGRRDRVIAIGASTGGVEALFAIIAALPADCPPILVVQHMPATFTGSFASRLDRDCRLHVVEAVDGTPLKRGTVYIAPGGERHMTLEGGVHGHIRLTPGDPLGGHRPAVDALFHSVAPLGAQAVGVILTGMGRDGAAGLAAMRAAGAPTLGQNQASCVVYGMPRAALESGAVEREVSLSAMPEAILAACRI